MIGHWSNKDVPWWRENFKCAYLYAALAFPLLGVRSLLRMADEGALSAASSDADTFRRMRACPVGDPGAMRLRSAVGRNRVSVGTHGCTHAPSMSFDAATTPLL